MSVGHIARGFEEAGIPTVIIASRSFHRRMEIMSLPRVLLTDCMMGRVFGLPGDTGYQRKVLLAALSLFRSATENGTIEHV